MADTKQQNTTDTKKPKKENPDVLFSFVFGSAWVLLAIFAVLIYWLSIREGKISDFAGIGDFFNIGTSFTSFVTVVLVYRAYRLQKEELRQVSAQLEAQTNAAKDEEKINRAIKLYEEYIIISENIDNNNDFNDIREKYKNLVNFSNRIVDMKKSKFKDYINFDVLEENLRIRGFINHFNRAFAVLNGQLPSREKELEKLEKKWGALKKTPALSETPKERLERIKNTNKLQNKLSDVKRKNTKIKNDKNYLKIALRSFEEAFPGK